MRKSLWAASAAAAALLPTLAFAQTTCAERQHDQRVAGTVIGGVAGALLGNAVSSHGGKPGGTIIGAVAGAAIGNQVTKGSADCSHAYGYYDRDGRWHATAVQASDASGYYDRDGNWVDGRPTGYYDNGGRWVAAATPAEASGYYDGSGRFIPASSQGYYDTDGRWVAGVASGYYDNGHWVAGPARGRYDENGRWMNGEASGHTDANGAWVADPQPGYYDTNGRWRRGQAMGYYDTRGRWIATGAASPAYATAYGRDTSVQAPNQPVAIPDQGRGFQSDHHDRWDQAGRDTTARESWLDGKIRAAYSAGTIDRRTAARDLRMLSSIRRDDARMRRHGGQLSDSAQARIQGRLDRLAESVQAD